MGDYVTRVQVYTVGCFDLMHHGHSNLLAIMRCAMPCFRCVTLSKSACCRHFGNNVIIGIHDDESYFKLKGE
jgi:glycerol-3-phosphate cytidylyltransferase-like family protein